MELSEKYGLMVDPDALISDITVGMQQRTEILKMLYRDNEVLIFDEPTAVLTPQEIDELMKIMKNLAKEGKPINSTRSWKLPTAVRFSAKENTSEPSTSAKLPKKSSPA